MNWGPNPTQPSLEVLDSASSQHHPITGAGQKLQPKRKGPAGFQRLAVNHSSPRPQLSLRGLNQQARVGLPRPIRAYPYPIGTDIFGRRVFGDHGLVSVRKQYSKCPGCPLFFSAIHLAGLLLRRGLLTGLTILKSTPKALTPEKTIGHSP